MNSSPEDFSRLSKLIRLKSHEQPPPGFFDNFSDKVIARIEAEGVAMQVSWWQRVFPELEAKPLLACAYGLVITGLLVVGLGISQSIESEEGPGPSLASPWFAQTPATASLAPSGAALDRPLSEQTASTSSVNPVFSSSAPRFLFEVNNQLPVQNVSYELR
jgi:hypothetical protein